MYEPEIKRVTIQKVEISVPELCKLLADKFCPPGSANHSFRWQGGGNDRRLDKDDESLVLMFEIPTAK